MRNENMAEIALTAAKSQKFETLHRRSSSPRTVVETIYRLIQGWRNFAHAQIAMWSLTHGHTLFWEITQFILIVQPYKLL